MDIVDIIVDETDKKVSQLKDYLSEGKADSFEEYKRMCGEIKGLLTARGYALDLKHNLENMDDE